MSKLATTIGFAILALGTVSVHAGLYISPNGPVMGVAVSDRDTNSGQSVSRVEGMVAAEADNNAYALGFGNNVPLSIAVDQIVPDGCWKINIDDDLGDREVSWAGGKAWDQVLTESVKSAGLKIKINEAGCIIGIGNSLIIAEAMASSTSMVWHLKTDLSLSENLKVWAQRAGWKLQWDMSVDYPIEHSATLIGSFDGESGVFSRVIDSFVNANASIKAVLHESNRVIQIVEGGYEQEEML